MLLVVLEASCFAGRLQLDFELDVCFPEREIARSVANF